MSTAPGDNGLILKCWKFYQWGANSESRWTLKLMWCLLLLFPAVKLAQVIRWSKPVYCNHLALMTVFVRGQWLNMSFISLWLSFTPTGQHNLLITLAISISLFLSRFPLSLSLSLSLSPSLSLSVCPVSLCSHIPPQPISLHLMEAKERQNDAVIKHGLCNSGGTVGCLLCCSLSLV